MNSEMRATSDGLDISLVMPARDEAGNIEASVRGAIDALSGLADRFEVIVVNDASRDGTGAILDDLALRFPQVRPVHLVASRGYGHALRIGYLHSCYPLIFLTDSDCQFDMREIALLLPLIGTHGAVIGYRLGRQDKFWRLIFSDGYNALLRWLFRLNVRDVNCAFKLFRRDVLEHALMTTGGYVGVAEVLVRANLEGVAITEVGVHHFPRTAEESKVAPWSVPLVLAGVFRLWWSMRSVRKKTSISEPVFHQAGNEKSL